MANVHQVGGAAEAVASGYVLIPISIPIDGHAIAIELRGAEPEYAALLALYEHEGAFPEIPAADFMYPPRSTWRPEGVRVSREFGVALGTAPTAVVPGTVRMGPLPVRTGQVLHALVQNRDSGSGKLIGVLLTILSESAIRPTSASSPDSLERDR